MVSESGVVTWLGSLVVLDVLEVVFVVHVVFDGVVHDEPHHRHLAALSLPVRPPDGLHLHCLCLLPCPRHWVCNHTLMSMRVVIVLWCFFVDMTMLCVGG